MWSGGFILFFLLRCAGYRGIDSMYFKYTDALVGRVAEIIINIVSNIWSCPSVHDILVVGILRVIDHESRPPVKN